MEGSTAGSSRLIPEQIWDGATIEEYELFPGKPTGSACPLVWAHAEYVKLRRSLRDGKVFDQPPQTAQRYLIDKTTSDIFPWRFNNKARSIPCGKNLRIAVLASARVHWSLDNWASASDVQTADTGLELHYVDLPTSKLQVGRQIVFTFLWSDGHWEDTNFTVVVE
jgi:glucoamylase